MIDLFFLLVLLGMGLVDRSKRKRRGQSEQREDATEEATHGPTKHNSQGT